MYAPKRVLSALLPTLSLAVLMSACDLMATPTPTVTAVPSTHTSVPTATAMPPAPTATPLPETDVYTDPEMGFSLRYPSGWAAERTGPDQVTFTSSESIDLASDEGAGMEVTVISLAELTPPLTEENLAENWEDIVSQLDFPVGESEPLLLGDVDGLRGLVDDPAHDIHAWLVLAVSSDHLYAFLAAVHPSDLWGEYEATLEGMIHSVEFFPPDGG